MLQDHPNDQEPTIHIYDSYRDPLIHEDYQREDDDEEIDQVAIEEHVKEMKASFGHKTIGSFGSISLLLGNSTGPAMVGLALQFQQGGWLLTLFSFIIILVTSSLSGLFLIESMASIPGNPRFQLRVEFTMLCRFYFGKWGYIISQIFINVSLQATNIASIIVCSQVMDSMLIHLFKKSCGLSAYPKVEWICAHVESESSSPFGTDIYMFFTLGYLIVLVLIIPLGFLNLDDNIIVQIGAVILMFTIVSSWIIMFCIHGLHIENMPTIGTPSGVAQIMGNVMFNYAYITTLPSWVNEAKPSVNINKTVWLSGSTSTIIFVSIGLFGALSFGHMPSSSDILSVLNSSSQANAISRISVYIFPFVVLASSIPVYSIIVRYNLMQNNLFPKWSANIVATILPWLIAIPLMTGDGLSKISNWSSLFFGAPANFIIPLLLYLRCLQFRKSKKHMSSDQKQILKTLVADTVNWEENQVLLTFEDHHSMFRVFRHIVRENCKKIAIGCLVILSILIPLVIVTNFVFGD